MHSRVWAYAAWMLVLCVAASPAAEAAVLHAVVVADTASHTGEAAAADLRRVQFELARVGQLCGLEVKLQVFDGEHDRAAMLLAIEGLQPEPDDCIVFYFVGHGYRTSKRKSLWPLLHISKERRNLDFELILEEIIAKHPRFALLVADCCNNVIDGPVSFAYSPRWDSSKAVAGYRRLFVESSGIVVVSAAKQGEYAYCHQDGHYYTEAFWRALQWSASRPNIDWHQLLDRASANVSAIQVPYHEILTYPR